MKKLFFLFTLSLLLVSVAWGQGLEDFTNSNATASYLDGTFIGNDEITWFYGHSRNEGDYPINGKGLMLRRASDSYLEATIPGGIATFSFEYRKAFTGTSARQLEVYVNNVLVGTTDEFGPTEPDPTVYTYSISDINTPGDVTVKIKNVGDTTTNRQTVIDNISWTSFIPSTPTLIGSTTELSGFSYVEASGPSALQTFSVSGMNLSSSVEILAPANFEIALGSSGSWSSSLTLEPSDGTLAESFVDVRLQAGLLGGLYSGNIGISSTGADPLSISLAGEVIEPIPAVFVDPAVLSGFSYYVEEGPSAEQSFTVSGEFLDGNVSLSVTADYEISSASEGTFGSSLTLYPSAGYLGETAVYVRQVAGLPIGSYSGTVTISALDVTDLTVDLSGAVEAAPEAAKNLFFSEYIEGSSNNKALEIYNASGEEVDLSDYKAVLYSNGSPDPGNTLVLSGLLAPGEVYVIANSSSIAAILAETDATSTVCYFNGDDAVGLIYIPRDEVIDQVGEIGFDPGSSWTVAGTTGATVNHTLIRKPSVLQGNTDWALQQGTNAENSEWIVMDNDYITNLGSHTFGTQVAASPVFNPPAGTYLAAIDVSISSETENAIIYYTTDGSEPSDVNGSVFSGIIEVSETTTIKAITYADGYEPSMVSEATYSIPVSVSTIAELRAMPTGASNVYTLTGEAVLTYQNANRNTKYIQDATAAIVIDDPATAITTAYMDYDGITGITGTLGVYNGLLQFTPVVDPGEATSSNNVVEPEVRTLASLISADQAKLIKITDATISGAAQFPSYASNLTITDASATGTLRTFPNTDYAGTDVPAGTVNMIGLVGEYNGAMQVSPRFLSDFEAAYDVPAGEETVIGNSTITLNGAGLLGANILEPAEYTPVPNPEFVASNQGVLQLVGTGMASILVSTTDDWFVYLAGGNWVSLQGPLTDHLIEVNLDAKDAEFEWKSGSGGNPTLPVEFASFTAILNASNAAVISWITETETNVSGYYVLRNIEDKLEDAIQISNLITAANSSSHYEYEYTDSELTGYGTYYYWLLVSNMDGSEAYKGPISLNYEYQEPEVPEIPTHTQLTNVYPNPFNPSTNIGYTLAAQQDVTIQIFNSRGQKVREYRVGEKAAGTYSQVWDGKDSSGNNVTTGVYFIRMQAGFNSFFKKAVLMK
jgi:flagellar hook assembly protein FlgD